MTTESSDGSHNRERTSKVTTMKARVLAVCLAVALGPVEGNAQQANAPYHLSIRSGRVLDGTGNPWFPADIGVRGGRIVTLGSLPGATATRTIDATGKYVTPGFIDIHAHADDGSSPRG